LPNRVEHVPPVGSSVVDQIHYHELGTGMHNLSQSIPWVLCAETEIQVYSAIHVLTITFTFIL